MGVYIKGVEMPNNCQECVCINDKYFYCQAVGRQPQDENVISRRPDWCPIVEVPQHGRLIDADAVERNLVKMQMAQKDVVGHGIRKSRAVVRDMPTVIEAEE